MALIPERSFLESDSGEMGQPISCCRPLLPHHPAAEQAHTINMPG